jgi:integrase
LIRAYESVSSVRASSRIAYCRAIRKIYAEVNRVPTTRKHDTRRGGRKSWIETVDALELDSVTPEKVLDWKHAYINGAVNDADRKRRIVTVNTTIRNAKALFARRMLPHLQERIQLPDPLPFSGVPLEKQPSTRYRSRTDARKILEAAEEELREKHPECYLIVCLALKCGLRRAEIDSLLWRSVDLLRRVIHVESNEYYQLKSEDSHGEIDLGEAMVETLSKFKKAANGEFVVEADRPAKPHLDSGSYRCQTHFNYVTDWLRKQGVKVARPLHELRKEVGSVIAQEHGIFAASRFLRHSDIRITSEYYLDKKQTIVPSFG